MLCLTVIFMLIKIQNESITNTISNGIAYLCSNSSESMSELHREDFVKTCHIQFKGYIPFPFFSLRKAKWVLKKYRQENGEEGKRIIVYLH